MTGLDNLAQLQAATALLTPEQSAHVSQYLLGAVSNYIDAETWERALGWAVESATQSRP